MVACTEMTDRKLGEPSYGRMGRQKDRRDTLMNIGKVGQMDIWIDKARASETDREKERHRDRERETDRIESFIYI